jgi:hypothetical protein
LVEASELLVIERRVGVKSKVSSESSTQITFEIKVVSHSQLQKVIVASFRKKGSHKIKSMR